MQPTPSTFDWLDFLSKAAGPVLAAIAAAILATWFATNRFYKEKWWEKRLDSFTEVIEISYKIKMMDSYFLECQYYETGDGTRGFTPHPQNVSKKLEAEYWLNLQELERITHLSEFTLTSEAAEILSSFLKKRKQVRTDFYNDSKTSWECQEEDYVISSTLLSSLVFEAKRNLKVKH